MVSLCLVLGLQTSVFAQGVSRSPYETRSGYGIQSQLSQQGQFRIRSLIGRTAMSRQGRPLGIIEDMIASERGDIQYIILSKSHAMGAAQQFVPIPWHAAGLRAEPNQVSLNLTQDQLENAPSFGRQNLQALARPQVQQRVNSYYQSGQYGSGSYGYGYSEDQYGIQEDYPQTPDSSYELRQGGMFGPYESHRSGETEEEEQSQPNDEENFPSHSQIHDYGTDQDSAKNGGGTGYNYGGGSYNEDGWSD